jgi:hypothetical protein
MSTEIGRPSGSLAVPEALDEPGALDEPEAPDVPEAPALLEVLAELEVLVTARLALPWCRLASGQHSPAAVPATSVSGRTVTTGRLAGDGCPRRRSSLPCWYDTHFRSGTDRSPSAIMSRRWRELP